MKPSGVAYAERGSLADRIDALLPQTQCARCGYPSCRDYAVAVASRGAAPNRCPPGGRVTVEALAGLLGCTPMALDPDCGAERPWVVARIDEPACIGCTLCIKACPVDAILGAAKRMHTVIASECTGCELCLEPCPVDCIVLEPMPSAPADDETGAGGDAGQRQAFLRRWMRGRAPAARRRFHNRQQRLHRLQARRDREREPRAAMPGRGADRATKQAYIRDAVERALQRRRGARKNPS